MKGLILAGGKGTRLRPLTFTGAKQLLPVANTPILFYAIRALRDAGIRDIGIVVGESAQEVEAAVQDGQMFGVRITYIHQEQPLGLAHAVRISVSFLQGEPFVMMLGDNLLEQGIADALAKFHALSPAALVVVSTVSNPEQFGVVRVQEGRVTQLVEKPTKFISHLAVVGVYVFGPQIYTAVQSIKPSLRGELEITDALQWLVAQEMDVAYHELAGWWKDTGRPDDLLAANQFILQHLKGSVEGEIDARSIVIGDVAIAAGARVIRSTLRGPLIIGEGAVVEDAYIGPYTSIGKRVRVRRAEVENSIVLDGCIVEGALRLDRSLLGKQAIVRQDSSDHPHVVRLVLGEQSMCQW